MVTEPVGEPSQSSPPQHSLFFQAAAGIVFVVTSFAIVWAFYLVCGLTGLEIGAHRGAYRPPSTGPSGDDALVYTLPIWAIFFAIAVRVFGLRRSLYCLLPSALWLWFLFRVLGP